MTNSGVTPIDTEDKQMSNDSNELTQNFGWYESLCCSLENVQQEFEEVAIARSELFHAMFQSDDRIDQEAWEAFIETNSGRMESAGWEKWEPMPDGWQCGCYYGGNEWLTHFQRIATSGYLILRDMQFHADEGRPVPDGFRLKLPPFGGHLGWLQLLYDTANLNTALLRSEVTCWNLDDGRSAIDLTEQEIWSSTNDGKLFPAHPLHFSLHLDLFRTSAEAIYCWFNPSDDVSVGGFIDDSPVCLPPLSDDDGTDEADTLIDDASQTFKPKWDGRRLWANGKVIKQYKNAAVNQKRILDAFQAVEWHDEVADPFDMRIIEKDAKSRDRNPKYELQDWMAKRREAVAELNKAQHQINFSCTGNGFGVSWEWKTSIDEPRSE